MIKYKMVVEELLQDLHNGVFNEAMKLPTEEELMNRFDVSRNTIRKAIDILVERGYIYQIQGSGMFLREFCKKGYLSLAHMKGLKNEIPNEKLTSDLRCFKLIEADEHLAKKFKCEVGTKIYSIHRIRSVNDEPFVIEEAYYNKEVIPYLNEAICTDSIYDYITNDLKLKIGFADKLFFCEQLNETDAKLLGLEEGNPVMITDNVVYLTSGVVFNYSVEKFNYKKAKFIALSTNRV